MSDFSKGPLCQLYEDSYDLYVLGSLEEPEGTSFAEHLASGCGYCHAQLQLAVNRTASISQAVPLVAPPAHLRSRFAAAIGATPVVRPNPLPWLLATAAALLFSVLTVWQFQVRRSEQNLSRSLAAEASRVSGMLEILAAPGTVELPLADRAHAQLHGALYVHKNLGMALVVDKLSTPPSGWVYQSWVVPDGGAPRPIESFPTDARGRAVSVLHGPVEVSHYNSMLISMEPVGPTPAKPTTLVYRGAIPKAG